MTFLETLYSQIYFYALIVFTNFRFGIINAVQTIQDIAKGEEFFVNYNYGFERAPIWFKDLYLEFLSEHPDNINLLPKVGQGQSIEELKKVYADYIKGAANLMGPSISIAGEDDMFVEVKQE